MKNISAERHPKENLLIRKVEKDVIWNFYGSIDTQVRKLLLCLNFDGNTTLEISTLLELKDRRGVTRNYIQPALKQNLIEMTIPDKPNSRLQKYRLTEKGMQIKMTIGR